MPVLNTIFCALGCCFHKKLYNMRASAFRFVPTLYFLLTPKSALSVKLFLLLGRIGETG